ncbi:MAG TPA: SMC-Scp complex subunit ScpB [Acidimicrobiales bacterium]|nr:SMC-Scp complex subunit ScpB [Acidimicrobiales bacterium]
MTDDPLNPPSGPEQHADAVSAGAEDVGNIAGPTPDGSGPDERTDPVAAGAEDVGDDAGPGLEGSGLDGSGPQPGEQVRADARRAIEAIILVSEQPIDVNLLAQLLELRPSIVEELCRELAAEYEEAGRGFQLARVAGGWRFQSHPDQAPYVERFVLAGQTAKLSAAALETLAIVAYKQPISRAQVASIRGVSVDGVMRTLQQRGYIAEVARDPGPGQASMFGTTRAFLEKLGVDSLSDLPALGDFVPAADVVEQLEQGLRPDGPTLPERLGDLEHTNSQRDLATKSPNGRLDRDLAEMDLAESRLAAANGGAEEDDAGPPDPHRADPVWDVGDLAPPASGVGDVDAATSDDLDAAASEVDGLAAPASDDGDDRGVADRPDADGYG